MVATSSKSKPQQILSLFKITISMHREILSKIAKLYSSKVYNSNNIPSLVALKLTNHSETWLILIKTITSPPKAA